MKQTPESFAQFLEVCKAEAAAATFPPGEDYCPHCDHRSILLQENLTHVVGAHATWKGKQYYYKCTRCMEEYTTNDSDLFSMASMKRIL